ncbi:MAG TPA: outer membrane lipoprotein carrier protein LolA [Cytophagaceae bacterium]|jgi:outer membrane lipoprotein-sorting protein|nr:outer membrane lipoprotein carrier protein LolA [Cytophagaceae bacterium]
MKKNNFLLLLTCIWVFSLTVQAQPKGYKDLKDTSSFRRSFNAKSKSIATNESDFLQEKYIATMTEKAVSKGKFYYKKANLMRWENTSPINHTIVLNNGKMMIKEKGKVKTYDTNSNKLFRSMNDMMLTTASGNMLNNKDYNKLLYENEKYYLVELVPTQTTAKKFIKTIEILVEKSDYTVSQIKMYEPSGDYTRIEFSNKKINEGIADATFLLK